MSSRTFKAKAILFDLDGTLVDSWHCIEYAWKNWCNENNLEYNDLVHKFNGSRAIDIIQALKPELNPENEKAKIDALELAHSKNISLIPGAMRVLNSIPSSQWGIVTSGSHIVVKQKLSSVQITSPTVLITAEKITQGKPHPQGYLQAAAMLKIDPHECLVFEDSPQGIKAARTAGMTVIALSTTFPPESLSEAHVCITNYEILDISVNSANIVISQNFNRSASNL